VARKSRGPGRPRTSENAFARWIDAKGWTRDKAAARLGVTVATINGLCRNTRRPSLELAFDIERLTDGVVTARSWLKVPPHKKG
jgi:transcriptional regulator with XRE-family HTH domain